MSSGALITLSTTSPEVFPENAIGELIDDLAGNPELEEMLIKKVREERERYEPDIILFWIMLALGESGTKKSARALFECLSGYELYLIHEFASYALTQLEEIGLRVIWKEFENNPDWESRLSSYSVLEEVCEYGDEELINKAVDFLKTRAKIEMEADSDHDLTEEVLWALAGYDDDQIDEFILSIMDQIPDTNETRGIRKVIKGQEDYSEMRRYHTPWYKYGKKKLT